MRSAPPSRSSVPIHEVTEDAGAARVSTFAGDPSRIDEGLRMAVQDVLPDARTIEGWMGIVMLVDRLTGTERTMTLLGEPRRARRERVRRERASRAGRRSDRAAYRLGERFEVPLAFDRAPRLVTV